jgi:hypothetical protein
VGKQEVKTLHVEKKKNKGMLQAVGSAEKKSLVSKT